ncbi:glycosyltransferase family 2 protein [Pluralibacter gergoviae]|nr:glycosyltransferase family 2 protein [Pluralibacter gergoviae]ELC3016781.1 glycosyltransferase family 2 protein [Pluralibacter gergoviae]ELC3022300.1 glycosyltransferase family 2 protein [Pluralibacter gergoviae]
MKDISVSVVIPYYNDSAKFERCILSVINQTVIPSEVIVIDDCSLDSDKLLSILDKYIDRNNIITFVYNRNDSNLNGAYSRNKGISIAHGEFVALLDADDFWGVNHIELCLNEFKNEDKLQFLYSDYYIEYKPSAFYRTITQDIKDLSNPYDIVLNRSPQTNSFFFRRELFPELNFDVQLKRHQDFQFLIMAIKNNLFIKKGVFCSSYYCISPRAAKTRVDFNSMLRFWENNYDLFTKKKLEKYLNAILYSALCVNGINGASEVLSRSHLYNYLDNKEFVGIIKLLGDSNKLSVMLIKFLYVSFFDFSNLKKRLKKVF